MDLTENTPLLGIFRKPVLSRGFLEFYENNVGLLLVTLAQLFFSVVDVSVQKLHRIDPPVTTLQLILVRMSITYVLSIAYMLSQGIPDPFTGPKGVRMLLVFRGFVGFFAVFGLYYSLKYLTVSEATVISFLAPFMVSLSGAVFLGETLHGKQLAAGAVSFLGVLFIARPEFLFGGLEDTTPADAENRIRAVAAGLMSCIGATAVYTSIRAIGSRAHALHSLTSLAGQSVLGSSIGLLITKTEVIIPTNVVWLCLLVVIGVGAFIGQFLLTLGLQRETAGRGTTAIYTQIVFVTILENIFFDYSPSPWSVAGIILIASAAVYIAVSKQIKPKNVDEIEAQSRDDTATDT